MWPGGDINRKNWGWVFGVWCSKIGLIETTNPFPSVFKQNIKNLFMDFIGGKLVYLKGLPKL